MNMLLRETGQMIRFNYKNLLLFVTGYRMVTAAVYFQLLKAGRIQLSDFGKRRKGPFKPMDLSGGSFDGRDRPAASYD